MTDGEMRVAIAEWMGWKPVEEVNKQTWWVPPTPDLVATYTLPDYPNDLNAMHEAEAKLDKNQQENYAHELSQVVPQNFNTGPFEEGGPDLMIHRDFDVLHATAHQRCEAFLKTLGLWRDSAPTKEAK